MAEKKKVFVAAHNICSPIGRTTAENFAAVKAYKTGVAGQVNNDFSKQPFFASLFEQDAFALNAQHTKFEQLLIASTAEALQQTGISPTDPGTLLIISTTKGNISLIEKEKDSPAFRQRVALTTSAQIVAGYFGFKQAPIIVSNACISGVLAIITGMRLLRAGVYENVVVTGADVISKFILSGFQSFQALSQGVCRPFDAAHDGLNLGEGAGTVILSTDPNYAGNICIKGGSVSNDANHISGPSRTGDELAKAILRAMADADVQAGDIDFISAHGTGTVYNDEMEAKAMRIAEVEKAPINSLKGYYGHTLGAAGLIETIISMESLKQEVFLATPGFEQAPEVYPLNVSATHRELKANNFLKTASGFGGCNAALIAGK
jgi:3-oxoacyl-[acyl-carrier-protein] synthase-1